MKRALICAMVLFAAAPVWADATVFVGANLTPTNRAVRGGAVGAGLLIIGFEGEYAFTPDDPQAAAPSLVTGSGNVLIQTPLAVLGLQPYLTTGAGLYREKLGLHQDTSFALNTGGGVKVSLVGPLRLRVDYRVFKLGSDALSSPAHRIYLGLNLKF
jgi:opacity protein-like surface antigen